MKSFLLGLAFGSTLCLANAPPMETYDVTISDSDKSIFLHTLAYIQWKGNMYASAKRFITDRNGLFSEAGFLKAGLSEAYFNAWADMGNIAGSQWVTWNKIASKNQISISTCSYDFHPRATNLTTYLGTVGSMEELGVSMLMGAIPLITDQNFTELAAGVLATAGRAAGYYRAQSGQLPVPDTISSSLSPKLSYSLIAPHIVNCSSSDSQLTAFPKLTLIKSGFPQTRLISFQLPKSFTIPDGQLYLTWTTQPYFAKATFDRKTNVVSAKIGASEFGQQYVVLTNSNTAITDDTVVAGPAIVQFGDNSEP